MEIEIFFEKSVDENAGRYYNSAKKAKKKLEGAKEALEISKKKLQLILKQEEKFLVEEEKKKVKAARKKEWYEKFHYFFSSEGFLCIGGKDATSNEIIIKKHLEKEDLVFHTDMAGSPFFIVKDGQKSGEITREETALAVAVYSKAWKLGHGTADVFYVKPEQVSKEARSGENLAKGSFMIYGKTTYIRPNLVYYVGLVGEEVIGGALSVVSGKTKNYVKLIPGREKKSKLAKKIKSLLKGGDLDDIIKFVPSGGGDLKVKRKKK